MRRWSSSWIISQVGRGLVFIGLRLLRQGGIDALLEAADAALASQNSLVDCLVPFARGDLVEEVHRTGTVERVEHETEGTRGSSRARALANRFVVSCC